MVRLMRLTREERREQSIGRTVLWYGQMPRSHPRTMSALRVWCVGCLILCCRLPASIYHAELIELSLGYRPSPWGAGMPFILLQYEFYYLIIKIIILLVGRNGSKDGPKGRAWEEKRIGLIYRKGQVFIYLQ
jgi:hypothetical protein